MSEPAAYPDVIGELQKLKAAGAPIEQARVKAQEMGWSLEELRAAKAGDGRYLNNIVAPALQGATLGFGDEITAGLRRVGGALGLPERYGGSKDFDKALGEERAILKRARADAPKTAMASEFGGALVPGLLTAGAATGATVPATMARSAGVGALQGAAYGAGSGEGFDDRVNQAKVGGIAGGAVGAAAPVLVEGLKAATRAGASLAAPRTAAVGELRRAVARDAMTPADLANRAATQAQVRPGEAMLMDAGGENVQGLVERVAQTPGQGRTSLLPRLEQRQQGQLIRLASDLRGLTGTSKTAYSAVEQTIKDRAAAATPLYQQAYKAPLAPQDEAVLQASLDAVSATPYGGKALAGAKRLLLSTPEFRGATWDQVPLTAKVDYWQRAARDMAVSAGRTGEANVARSVNDMIVDVVGKLDKANPVFGQARAAWAGPSAYMEAIEQGRGVLGAKMGPEELAATFTAMTPSEQEGFRIGAVSALVGKMGDDAAKAPDLTKYLRSPNMRAKLLAILPDQASREKWANILDTEMGFSGLYQRATGNSATARRLAEAQDGQAGNLMMQFGQDALQGTSLWNSMMNMLGRSGTAIRDSWRSRTDNALAKALQTQGAPQTGALTKALTAPVYTPTPSRAGPMLAYPAAGALMPVVAPSPDRRDLTMPY